MEQEKMAALRLLNELEMRLIDNDGSASQNQGLEAILDGCRQHLSIAETREEIASILDDLFEWI